jgi:hypothetical protein
MSGAALLVDAFDRVKEVVHEATEGLSPDELMVRLDPGANSIGWLIWHLTRIQDDHVADAAKIRQAYVDGGWWERLGRPYGPDDHGYAQTSEQVGSLRIPTAAILLDYHDAVHEQTIGYVRGLGDEDFNRVVDTSWNPPVTLGVRLVSVISDDLQHAGQAAFIRGTIDRG